MSVRDPHDPTPRSSEPPGQLPAVDPHAETGGTEDSNPELSAQIEALGRDEGGLREDLEKQAAFADIFGPDESPSTAMSTIGRFEVVRSLGRGGMGEVFAAHDPELDRWVAIKRIHRAETEHHIERFNREGRALARLSHPNIVQVYEVGQHEGSMFIVMELVEGQTLGAWTAGDRGRRRSGTEILQAYVQAGRGLAAAHAADLVHRDFKPENVMVGDDGRPRVLDFGLAREVGELDVTKSSELFVDEQSSPSHGSGSMPRVTRTGTVLGTPSYMAPEQHRGEPATAASDQYSFCASLYQALHGMPPFVGATRFAIYEASRGRQWSRPKGTTRIPNRQSVSTSSIRPCQWSNSTQMPWPKTNVGGSATPTGS